MDEARARRLTLIACILGSSIVVVDQTVVNIALPSLRDDLDATLADRQWVVEACLLLLRAALQGGFGALLVPSSLAVITAVFTGAERAAAIGSWTAGTAAAVAVGPPLGRGVRGLRAGRARPDAVRSIFRTRNFAVGNLVTLVVYAGLGAATFFVALFLQQVAGYSALEAGLALPPITLMLISLSRRFGELSARLGPRTLMSGGPLVGGFGLPGFARLHARAG
jgi:predicted MFS family arabinose efflux permease